MRVGCLVRATRVVLRRGGCVQASVALKRTALMITGVGARWLAVDSEPLASPRVRGSVALVMRLVYRIAVRDTECARGGVRPA